MRFASASVCVSATGNCLPSLVASQLSIVLIGVGLWSVRLKICSLIDVNEVFKGINQISDIDAI